MVCDGHCDRHSRHGSDLKRQSPKPQVTYIWWEKTGNKQTRTYPCDMLGSVCCYNDKAR